MIPSRCLVLFSWIASKFSNVVPFRLDLIFEQAKNKEGRFGEYRVCRTWGILRFAKICCPSHGHWRNHFYLIRRSHSTHFFQALLWTTKLNVKVITDSNSPMLQVSRDELILSLFIEIKHETTLVNYYLNHRRKTSSIIPYSIFHRSEDCTITWNF